MERAGVTLRRNDDKLQVCSDTPLTEVQSAFLKDHRDDLLRYVQVMEYPNIQTLMTVFDAKVQSIHPNETTLV